jgi:phosphatidylglycerophosphatase A
MLKKLAYIIGTGLGSGYVPWAPGTAGSFSALLIFYLIPLADSYWLIFAVILFVAGLWSSTRIERDLGVQDPPQVVIDEWVGQWLALLFLPRSGLILLLGFLIFRIMDILKPFPARNSQVLKGGWGIMIDDVIAAVYTNITIRLIILINSR